MIHLLGAARTDVGLNRDNNEDSFFFDDDLGLYLVADGMGGHASGEVASAMVAQTVSTYIKHFMDKPDEDENRYRYRDPELSSLSNTILQAIHLATRVVYDAAQKDTAHHGMGSTLVMLMTEADELLIAHVGDSRAFRLRDGQLEQLTVDHNLSADPQFEGVINYDSTMVSAMGNTLTRAMGIKTEVMPDLNRFPIQGGDLYLICSDGLTDMATDEMIATVLSGSDSLKKKAGQLIELALAGGGKDNVTVVLAQPGSKKHVFKNRLTDLLNKDVKEIFEGKNDNE